MSNPLSRKAKNMNWTIVLLIWVAILSSIHHLNTSSTNITNSINPTYMKDIQPIFKNRCSQCHDYMGSKNWQIYQNAYTYRDKIKQKILSKEMPQGRDMPQSERDLIVKWVDTGSKM